MTDTQPPKKSDDSQHLAVNAILLIIGKMSGTLSMIALFILLSYLFSATDYGSFRQTLLINKSLLEVFALGLPMSIYYFLSRLNVDSKKSFIVQSLVLLAVLGAFCSSLVFLFSGFIADKFNNADLEALLKLFSLYPFLVLPTLALEGVLVTLGHTKRYAIFLIIDKLAMLSFATISVLVYQSIEVLFVVLIVFSSIELLAAILLVKASSAGLPLIRKNVKLLDQFKIALPSGFSNIVDIINVELDKIIIGLFFSVSQFAKYANGAFEIPFIGTVANATTSVLMPEYVRNSESGNYSKIIQLWHGAIIKVAILFIPLIAFLFFNAAEFITLMFSEKYIESAVIFQIYLIANLPKLTWYGPLLVSMGYAREPLVASLYSLVCNVVLNIVLINWMGFVGPAVATVTTTYLLTGYFLFRIKGAMKLHWRDVFPWRKLAIMVMIAGFLGSVLNIVLGQLELGSVLLLSIGSLLYFGVTLSVFTMMGIVTRNDILFVKRYLLKFIPWSV